MIATSAKLRELAATTWSADDRAVLGSDGFEILVTSVRGDLSNLARAAAAPALARLVLELSEALDNAAVSWHSEHESSMGPSKYQDCERWEVCRNATKALAAVEELKL